MTEVVEAQRIDEAQLVGEVAQRELMATSPAWLAQRRRAAWEAYETLPMPSHTRDEDYRRTDISKLHPAAFTTGAPGRAATEALVEVLRVGRDRAAPDSTFGVNSEAGMLAVQRNDLLTAQGVITAPLEEAAARHPELVQQAFMTLAVGETKFTALWDALWRGGAFIYVPAGVQASAPVWIAHGVTAAGTAVFPATVVVLGEHARLDLVEVYGSGDEEGETLSNAVSLMVLGAGSELRYSTVQQWGSGVWHMGLQRATLGSDARLRMFSASLGGRLQKQYWEAVLDGRGADAEIVGICFGDDRQHFDHQSLQAHRAPSCRSTLLLKVAVRDHAQSVYSGLIDVEPAAQKTDGYVQNRNLILSQGARANSIPRLEIRANDVRCSHGSTAGHIDLDQRFYLRSRGVPAADADRIIVRGFMEDALDRSPHPRVADLVGGLLDAELANHILPEAESAIPSGAVTATPAGGPRPGAR